MYYIKNGLSKHWQFLAVLYSLFGVLTVFGTGNATQVNLSLIHILDSYFACGAAPPPELGVRLVPCTTIAGHCVLPAVPAKALRVGSRRVQGFLAAFCRPEMPPEHWTALLDSELAGQLGIR